MAKFYVVSVYEVNQGYGGPEEGGWWYTHGEPYVELGWMTKVVKTEDEAVAAREELNLVVEAINKQENRHPPSSVRCDGWLVVEIEEDTYPAPFPLVRPHYE